MQNGTSKLQVKIGDVTFQICPTDKFALEPQSEMAATTTEEVPPVETKFCQLQQWLHHKHQCAEVSWESES